MVHARKMMDSAIDVANDSMRNVRNAASHRLHDFSEAASDKLHHVGAAASDYAHLGPQKAREMARCTTDMVQQRPMQSTLIAVGLSCLLAACFVRR